MDSSTMPSFKKICNEQISKQRTISKITESLSILVEYKNPTIPKSVAAICQNVEAAVFAKNLSKYLNSLHGKYWHLDNIIRKGAHGLQLTEHNCPDMACASIFKQSKAQENMVALLRKSARLCLAVNCNFSKIHLANLGGIFQLLVDDKNYMIPMNNYEASNHPSNSSQDVLHLLFLVHPVTE
jgi:hypothetical protein